MKHARYSAIVVDEGDWQVAHCPDLDVTSQGHTYDQALKNLREAIQAYLQSFGKPRERKSKRGPILTILEV
jgi:predicted RNase H-like HicB family nuclease